MFLLRSDGGSDIDNVRRRRGGALRGALPAPQSLTGAPELLSELLDTHERLDTFLDRAPKVFAQEGAVNIALVGFDDRVRLGRLV
jgi:hypothetical protein